MRSAWTHPPVYDRTNPNRTGPSVVNYDLDQLKVGENWVVTGRRDGHNLRNRDIAPGDGWSRALYAPECAWPRGADLCVRVEWHPDREVGSDWDARLEAVTTGLRSLDYVVERAGRPINPEQDLQANLLVYRMEPGKTPPQRSDDAWAHVPPPRTYTWRETSPLDGLRYVVGQANYRDRSRMVVWDIESALWPPEASFCGHLRWWPAPGFAFSAAVHDDLREFIAAMQDAGYRTRLQERPIPDEVGQLDLLVYREADSATPA